MLHRLDRGCDARGAGGQDDRQVEIAGAHGPEEVQAGKARHLEIADDELEAVRGQPLHRLQTVGGGLEAVASTRERGLIEVENVRIVIDQEQTRACALHFRHRFPPRTG